MVTISPPLTADFGGETGLKSPISVFLMFYSKVLNSHISLGFEDTKTLTPSWKAYNNSYLMAIKFFASHAVFGDELINHPFPFLVIT